MRIGDWTVDADGDRLLRDGQAVKLEPRLMRLLVCLAASPGRVVPVPELLATVWADVVVTPESVYQAVAALRRALGDDGRHPAYIATVPRKGYRLVAEVQLASATDAAGADAADAAAVASAHTQVPDAAADGRHGGAKAPSMETSLRPAPDTRATARPAVGAPGRAPAATSAVASASASAWLASPFRVAVVLSAVVLLAIGARVWFAAPPADAILAADAEPAATPAGTQTGPQVRDRGGATKTVLWVDDRPANNDREREAMRSFGIDFVLALSTDEALQLLATRRFDLVISDQRRGSDPKAGFTLLSHMRMQRGDRTPFVLYTSECSAAETMEARALGALACTTLVSELMQSALVALEARP